MPVPFRFAARKNQFEIAESNEVAFMQQHRLRYRSTVDEGSIAALQVFEMITVFVQRYSSVLSTDAGVIEKNFAFW